MKKFIGEQDRIVTIAVDVQNDFCPGGKLAVNDGDQVVPPINQLFEYTRANQGAIIVTGDQHPANTPHFDLWPVHCVEDTNGAKLRTDLDVQPEDFVINKGTGQTNGYSGFEGATVDGQTIETIINPAAKERIAILIGGLATDYCVVNTVMDALEFADRMRVERQAKIAVYAITDAMRAVNINPDDGEKALEKMEKAGAILVTTDDIMNKQE